ncbi:uncharacterized protein LOC128263509 [Drosophila gunungcola]|uniref:uncharacterized protein LOC128263509 n=1 Tax=Drosophila gunungcola TaxID=103775 RepID=UPI0022E1A7ED|nr:uncharacterized protein LOC128263509 [Drosophila gunungcola]
MRMGQLLRYFILVALLPLFKAQDKNHEDTLNVTNIENNIITSGESLIASTSWPAIDNQQHEDEDILITTQEPVEQTLSPLLRCLSCKFCAPYEGKSLNEKGKKWCPLRPGVLNGCISIYYNFSSNAGGPEGYINRSCFSDLSESDLEYCKKHEKVCHKCYSADCNNMDITSNGLVTEEGGGARILVSKFLMIASSIGFFLNTLLTGK